VKNRSLGLKTRNLGLKTRSFGLIIIRSFKLKTQSFGVENTNFGLKNRSFGLKTRSFFIPKLRVFKPKLRVFNPKLRVFNSKLGDINPKLRFFTVFDKKMTYRNFGYWFRNWYQNFGSAKAIRAFWRSFGWAETVIFSKFRAKQNYCVLRSRAESVLWNPKCTIDKNYYLTADFSKTLFPDREKKDLINDCTLSIRQYTSATAPYTENGLFHAEILPEILPKVFKSWITPNITFPLGRLVCLILNMEQSFTS
jgi:hypothetical protein